MKRKNINKMVIRKCIYCQEKWPGKKKKKKRKKKEEKKKDQENEGGKEEKGKN